MTSPAKITDATDHGQQGGTVTSKTSVIERTDRYEITGGDVRPVRHSRDGRQYRVDSLEVKTITRDGREGPPSFRLRGQVLKKDGSDSMNRADEPFWHTDPVPRWVVAIHAGTDA